MNVPIPGDITVDPKLRVPVMKAYVVPSIFLGVIFANNAIIGRVKRSVLITEKTTSVKNKNATSGIPQLRFHLLAKANWKKLPTITKIKPKRTVILVSKLRKNAL